ncbi:hypothetical protein GQ457_11G002860 [Hibiscus cannabinus]
MSESRVRCFTHRRSGRLGRSCPADRYLVAAAVRLWNEAYNSGFYGGCTVSTHFSFCLQVLARSVAWLDRLKVLGPVLVRRLGTGLEKVHGLKGQGFGYFSEGSEVPDNGKLAGAGDFEFGAVKEMLGRRSRIAEMRIFQGFRGWKNQCCKYRCTIRNPNLRIEWYEIIGSGLIRVEEMPGSGKLGTVVMEFRVRQRGNVARLKKITCAKSVDGNDKRDDPYMWELTQQCWSGWEGTEETFSEANAWSDMIGLKIILFGKEPRNIGDKHQLGPMERDGKEDRTIRSNDGLKINGKWTWLEPRERMLTLRRQQQHDGLIISLVMGHRQWEKSQCMVPHGLFLVIWFLQICNPIKKEVGAYRGERTNYGDNRGSAVKKGFAWSINQVLRNFNEERGHVEAIWWGQEKIIHRTVRLPREGIQRWGTIQANLREATRQEDKRIGFRPWFTTVSIERILERGALKSMEEQVAKLMENLTFSEEELIDVGDDNAVIDMNLEGSEKWLVGKLVSPEMVDTSTLTRVFFAVWKDTPLEEVMVLGPNLFLFKFKKEESKESVIQRCPWSFNGELLALKVFDGLLSPQEYDFGPLPMWMRVYKVPLGMMNQRMGESIGNRLGNHIAVDMREGEGRMGEYLRVRVEIDSCKALKRCVVLGKQQDGSSRICMVKYERLPKFCHYCGIIGHGWELCLTRPEGMEGPFQFGDWLKVEQGNQGPLKQRMGIVYKNQDRQETGVPRGRVKSGNRWMDSGKVMALGESSRTVSNGGYRFHNAKRTLQGKTR